ncbi:response regulator transcription factor [Paenibacillus sp. FSL H7-0331]|uniref:response regulator transcription factor n=1 Tax=Paenibacillus sp. FSL H7-0331 TaxID=1920421 RepID=UPI00096FB040|nr:response regulator transcription factor [Paenibacillus sp. FSL H7-0331]OMF18931.1 DNA-binding response regulator [Paenibacillus sp. FSL H7-0331]
MEKCNVLIVDDDAEIVEAVSINLRREGLNVFTASNGLEALEVLERNEIHLILLDVMMPKLDGIQATLKIRETKNIPILIVSAKTEDADKIVGLNAGADDYISKPFSPLELIARVKSQLRRYTRLGNYKPSEDVIYTQGLALNKSTKTITVDEEVVRLTATEYKILELLMENKGRVFSIEEIYEKVWREPSCNGENTVAVHVRRIREKIEINPREPKYLKVVWGIGYKIEK